MSNSTSQIDFERLVRLRDLSDAARSIANRVSARARELSEAKATAQQALEFAEWTRSTPPEKVAQLRADLEKIARDIGVTQREARETSDRAQAAMRTYSAAFEFARSADRAGTEEALARRGMVPSIEGGAFVSAAVAGTM